MLSRFNQLVKAVQQRTQCSPHYARKCVISGLQNGTLTKTLGGYGAQLAMRQSQTNAKLRPSTGPQWQRSAKPHAAAE